MITFTPRRYFVNTIIFFVVFGLFWIIGLVFLSGILNGVGDISGSSESIRILNFKDEQALGLIFLAFSTLVLGIMCFKALAIGSSYTLTGDTLIISGLLSKNTIPYREIGEIKRLAASQVEELVVNLEKGERQNALNPTGFFQTFSEYANLIKYCTVPIVVSKGRHGRVLGARTHGEFLLLCCQNNKNYLISPKDLDGFVAALKEYGIGNIAFF